MNPIVHAKQQKTLNSLSSAGLYVQAAAVLVVLAGIVVAISLFVYTSEGITDGVFGPRRTQERPYIGLGLGVFLGSLVQGLLLWTIGLGARAWAVINYPFDPAEGVE